MKRPKLKFVSRTKRKEKLFRIDLDNDTLDFINKIVQLSNRDISTVISVLLAVEIVKQERNENAE